VKAAAVAIPVIALVVLGAGGEFFAIRGRLAAERDTVNAAWTSAEMALEGRAALLPELAELVRGYAPHETALFAKTAEAGLALLHGRTPKEKIAANGRLSGALSRLLALSEKYPALQSNRNFTRLEREIADAENNIAVERRKYNELLERYNTSLQIFPNNIVSRLAGFKYNGAYLRTDQMPVRGFKEICGKSLSCQTQTDCSRSLPV
jgi:LemA protein